MRSLKLWGVFVLTVSITMASAFFVTGFVTFFFSRAKITHGQMPFKWLPVLGLGTTAIIISILLTLLISRRFFVPIERLIGALQKVAAGNFDISLPEQGNDSEILEMNLNFNKMVKELNSMEMLQADFIQNVSHEFKTPLSAIEGYATLLNTAVSPEEYQLYAQKILQSTRHLTSLTSNVLKLSKLENQSILSEKHVFSLDEQIRQAILSLEADWSSKELDFIIDLPSVPYLGNEDLLNQVWTNLISNAVKFTPKHGSITVSCQTKGDFYAVTVADTGIGMEPEIQNRIFDKFYQGDPNRATQGNGLGLALVKKIIDLLHGKITVSSKPDEGTIVIVYLPN